VEPDDGSEEPSGDELEDLLLELGSLKEERDAALAEGDLESFGRIQTEMDAVLEQVLGLVPDPAVTTTTAATEA
jgi:hypothetical protein